MMKAQQTCARSYTPRHQRFADAAILQCFTYIILLHTSDLTQQNNHFNLSNRKKRLFKVQSM